MRIGLIGNPNVGKSLIFHQLTGIGVEVSNYPGSTVNLQHGTTCFGKTKLEIIDLPGTYSLDGDSEEEKIVRSFATRGEGGEPDSFPCRHRSPAPRTAEQHPQR